MDDPNIWPIMQELKECMCQTLEDRGLMPGDCFCGVLPGDNVSYDYTNGMAWVRLVDSYPSSTFPSQDSAFTSCQAPLAATLEVAALNCVPGLTASGVFPGEAILKEATRLQLATMHALRYAIQCCEIEEIMLGAYTPVGPQGNLVGGFWQVNVGQAI